MIKFKESSYNHICRFLAVRQYAVRLERDTSFVFYEISIKPKREYLSHFTPHTFTPVYQIEPFKIEFRCIIDGLVKTKAFGREIFDGL